MDDATIRKTMQGNTRKDTMPELAVRRILREIGYPGYRLQWRIGRRFIDIAYPGRKIAIFVNGCFWHHHEGCPRATIPGTNSDFWIAKFERNRSRDSETIAILEADGWRVLTIWECELKGQGHDDQARRLQEFMESASS